MEEASLGHVLALERCRIYLAQIRTTVHCFTKEDERDRALRAQIFRLSCLIQDDLSLLSGADHEFQRHDDQIASK